MTAPWVEMFIGFIWGLYPRLMNKIALFSTHSFTNLEIAKCVFDGIQIGGHCWLMPTIRWKDPFNRRTDRRRLAGCWHTSLLTSQTSVCSAEKKESNCLWNFQCNFYKNFQIGLDLSKTLSFFNLAGCWHTCLLKNEVNAARINTWP